jgi:hypothetical protein
MDMTKEEIEISIFSEKIRLDGADVQENEEQKKMYDPFYNNKIARSIDDVKIRAKVCKFQGQKAVGFYRTYHQTYETFQLTQVVREYGWLFFYVLKSHSRILVEYFGGNKHKFQHFEEELGPKIITLAKMLEAYRNELVKQQTGLRIKQGVV